MKKPCALTVGQPKGVFQWLRLYALYRSAFPTAERKPFAVVRRMHRKGKTDIWYFEKDGKFAGLVMTINGQEQVLLDYVAVAKKHRGTGVGSSILQMMRAHYAPRGIFVEIESVYEDAPDQAERERRKHFYLKNGMQSMGVMVRLFGVKMELLGFDCRLDFAQYHSFYRDNYGKWAAERVEKADHPDAAR